ncbi:hypothetical protein C5C18_07585 [Rathayibacter tritici]|nr:hypothetical protein C5C18_07585 [Rathayibacter tritici]
MRHGRLLEERMKTFDDISRLSAAFDERVNVLSKPFALVSAIENRGREVARRSLDVELFATSADF